MPENDLKLETLTEHPFNAATPLSALRNARTLNSITYVRNLYSVPDLDKEFRHVSIGRAVELPRVLSFVEVQNLGTWSRVITQVEVSMHGGAKW